MEDPASNQIVIFRIGRDLLKARTRPVQSAPGGFRKVADQVKKRLARSKKPS